MEDTLQFITYLIQEFEMIKNVNITVFDAERIIQTKKVNINKEFKEFSEQMEQNTENNDIKQLCIIIGLDKFLNDLDDDKNAFSKALQKAEDAGIYNFIFIENATRLKNHQYDDWYKKYILGDTGIWLGNGIEDQYLLNVNSRREVSNNCGISFGYAVKQGQTTLIKLLGVKEKGDDNE